MPKVVRNSDFELAFYKCLLSLNNISEKQYEDMFYGKEKTDVRQDYTN